MTSELDPKIAERLASSALHRLPPSKGSRILCTRAALKTAMLQVAQEAHEIGFLGSQKERLSEVARPGSADRPPWMDIRLDDPVGLANHKIRFKPVVLKSLLDAGYRCFGDLRWASNRELMQFHYVGIRTAREIRAIIRRFDRSSQP